MQIDQYNGSYTFRKTGYQRFLYRSLDRNLTTADFYGAAREIDGLIEEVPRLKKADSSYYLVFPPQQEFPSLWVGRDVIGYLDQNEHPFLFCRDFPPGVVFSFSLAEIPLAKNFSGLEQRCRTLLMGKGIESSPFWRLRWEVVSAQDVQMEMQFFLKNYSWETMP